MKTATKTYEEKLGWAEMLEESLAREANLYEQFIEMLGLNEMQCAMLTAVSESVRNTEKVINSIYRAGMTTDEVMDTLHRAEEKEDIA